MARARIFSTLDAFNQGYAGPQTLVLEARSRTLAGRQDNFCLICGDHAGELFPQLGPSEIHLCPRQFCEKCYHIQAHWKHNSSRFKLELYQRRAYVPQCCPLCWKRGWDWISPLIGSDQPGWTTKSVDQKQDILERRHKHWEDCAATGQEFVWRRPFLTSVDDGSLESDRNLAKAICVDYLKKQERFTEFPGHVMLEATVLPLKVIESLHAFEEHALTVVGLVSPFTSDNEEEADIAAHSPSRMFSCRPQRQASRLSFVTGQPVLQESTKEVAVSSSTPHCSVQLTHTPPDIKVKAARDSPIEGPPRRRGRPRKVVSTQIPPLPSPSAKSYDTTPVPASTAFIADNGCGGYSVCSSTLNDEIDKEIAGHDDPLDQAMAMISKEKERLRGRTAQHEAEMRLAEEGRTRDRRRLEELEAFREATLNTETDLKSTLSTVQTERAALHDKVSTLEDERAALHDTVSKSENERTALHDKVSELEVERTALRDEVSELKVERTAVYNKIANMEDEWAALNDKVSTLEDQKTAQYNKVSKLEDVRTDLHDRVLKLEDESECQQQTVRALREVITISSTTRAAEADRLREQIGNQQLRQTEVEEALALASARETELRNIIANNQYNFEKQTEMLVQLNKDNAHLEHVNRVVYTDVARLQQKLYDPEKEQSQLEADNRKKQERIDGLLKGHATLREGQQETMEQNKDLLKDLAQFGAEFALTRGIGVNDLEQLGQELLWSGVSGGLLDRLRENRYLYNEMIRRAEELNRHNQGLGHDGCRPNTGKRKRPNEASASSTATQVGGEIDLTGCAEIDLTGCT